MKKYSILILVLALTATLFTGCGCRNSRPMNTVPTTLPTTTATSAPTQATTHPTTEATTEGTVMPSNGSEPTVESGNAPAATENTETAGENNRARRVVPKA